MVGFVLRTIRWRLMYTGKVSFSNSLTSIILCYAGNNLLPFRGGELLRIVYFSKIENQSKINVTTSLLSEKLLDIFSILLLLYTLSLVYPKGDSELLNNMRFYSTILLLIPLLMLVFIRIFSKNIRHWIFKSNSKRKNLGSFLQCMIQYEKTLKLSNFFKLYGTTGI